MTVVFFPIDPGRRRGQTCQGKSSVVGLPESLRLSIMSRLFPQHKYRAVESLDGAWDFYFPKEGTSIGVSDWENCRHEVLEIPSVWEMSDRYKTYRGQAVARKVIHVGQPCHLRLVFKGVSHTATVYLDDNKIGRHHNAFTPFTLDSGEVAPGEHEVLVYITNEYGDLSALHIPNDYYNYGGISRSAEMHMISHGVLVRHVHVVTTPHGDGWTASVIVSSVNIWWIIETSPNGRGYAANNRSMPAISNRTSALRVPA